VFSSRVNSSSRWWNWKTKPRFLLRSNALRASPDAHASVPEMVTLPESGGSSIPRMFRRVLFPEPLGPVTATISPRCTIMSIPRRTEITLSPCP